MTQDELKSSLKAIADKQWATNQQAILLSAVALELAKDYRTLLDGKSLKVFI